MQREVQVWVGYCSTVLGWRLSSNPQRLMPSAISAHLLQAGVALGLARIVSRTFPDWGPDFSALEAGVVLMNLFSGPPLFKV